MSIGDIIKGTTTVDQARAEVQRLAEAERRGWQVAHAKAEERHALEHRTGAEVLALVDGEDQEARQLATARKLADQITRLQVDEQTAERAVQTARQQRPEAIR